MKRVIPATIIITWLSVVQFAGSLKAQTAVEKPAQVFFELKNNSLVPKKITVVSYEPGTAGNGTQSFFLLPYTGKSLSFRAGTRLYLVDKKQIDTVMSGNPLIGKPWYVLNEKDHKQSINLYGK